MASTQSTGLEQPEAVVAIDEARRLVRASLERIGVHRDDIDATAEHILEAEIRDRGGFERLFILADTVARHGVPTPSPMTIVRETETTAMLDGGWHLGYAVAARATELAIAKASEHGLAIVGAGSHRYSGVLGLYVERAARERLVAIAVSSGTILLTAPHGGRERVLSTNPIAMGFPTGADPIVWDTATAAAPATLLTRAAERGEPLSDGIAVDAAGRPTSDPSEALAGAVLTWGGHRGSGLAIAIQLLGLLCGIGLDPAGPEDWEAAFLLVAIDPSLLLDPAEYERGVAAFADGIREAPPAVGHDAVRMPSDRSMAARRRRLEGGIEVAADDLERLRALAG